MVGRWIWPQNGAFSAYKYFQERLLLVLGRFSFHFTQHGDTPKPTAQPQQVHGMMPRLHVSWWEISWMVTSVKGFLRPYPSIWVVRYSLHLFFFELFVLVVSGWYVSPVILELLVSVWFCLNYHCVLPLKQSHLQKCKSMQVDASLEAINHQFSGSVFIAFASLKKHMFWTSTSPDTSSGWWHWFLGKFYSDQTNCPLVNPKMVLIVREFPPPKCWKHSGLGVIQ